MKVYFVGAGPGDPELITVKGMKLLQEAPVIIYAGSLVNKELLNYAKKDTAIYNSATLTLEEVVDIIKDAVANNLWVVRLHTGDPALFGAIQEQMELLDKEGIEYQVVPGVSSFLAAAAAIKSELTIPEVSQTVIITRLAGRTPVPETQQLASLAKHQASLCIFLSIQMMEEVVKELQTYYPATTPVAIIEKASWPEERIMTGTLETISQQVASAGIQKTAMILVGQFLNAKNYRSLLYHPEFTHEYREASQ
ncbi:MAG: precorrin-4 C(11)-methyltransferase [Bacillota bacterium]|nr:precorrin-4 C(11)-methyltransferase [Bacillota bacterium]